PAVFGHGLADEGTVCGPLRSGVGCHGHPGRRRQFRRDGGPREAGTGVGAAHWDGMDVPRHPGAAPDVLALHDDQCDVPFGFWESVLYAPRGETMTVQSCTTRHADPP